MRLCCFLLLLCVVVPSVQAQQILDVYRPRIAVAADGSFAVAYTARVENITTADNVVVQRFAPDGTPIGPLHFFAGESCSGLDLWTSDFMYDAELAFQSDGTLLVLMVHEGWFSISVDDVYSSEATLAAIDASGQVIDLHSSGNCLQDKLIFPGGGNQTRPRMAIGPGDEVLVTLQGRFQDADFSNVAIRILDAAGNEIVEEAIPHDDPQARASFHQYPDIAASASLLLSVWHECVALDNQGTTNDCDVVAQFVDAQTLQAVGTNIAVNDAGVGQPNTYSIWPSVAMNAAGQSVVVWGDSRVSLAGDVFAQRYDPSGQPVGGNLRVSDGSGAVTDRPEVAMLDDGRFLVVWEDSTALGFRARSRAYDAGGQPTTGPTLLTTAEAALPAVAAGPGGFVTAWMGLGATGRAVRTSNLGLVVSNDPSGEAPVLGDVAAIDAYPHPFREATTLRYTLDAAGPVRVTVVDLLGREVARLVDAAQAPGPHEVRLPGHDLAPGTYVVRVEHRQAQRTRLLVRLR